MTPDGRRPAAYGGPGFSPRVASHRAEIGTLWRACGIADEVSPLREVLLHRPGAELEASRDPDAVQMLEPLDPARASAEHDAIAAAYREAGVEVHQGDPAGAPSPNLMFCADLLWMTPEGTVLARPASTVRAGEERHVARRLADLGVPILRTLTGTATFEGADAAWIDPETALVARGLRTSAGGAAQVVAAVQALGARAVTVDLPPGTMHLMGTLRFVARDLAVVWPGRTPEEALPLLLERGYRLLVLPEGPAAEVGRALNFVTLAPMEVLMLAGLPRVQRLYEAAGVRCRTVEAGELPKAAGAIGCLTGVLRREIPPSDRSRMSSR
jgi:arginine deiminase